MRLTVVLLLLTSVMLCGCQALKVVGSDLISDTVGINREITLYAVDGTVIKRWSTRNTIDTSNGVCSFMANEKKVLIGGTFLVEEK